MLAPISCCMSRVLDHDFDQQKLRAVCGHHLTADIIDLVSPNSLNSVVDFNSMIHWHPYSLQLLDFHNRSPSPNHHILWSYCVAQPCAIPSDS